MSHSNNPFNENDSFALAKVINDAAEKKALGINTQNVYEYDNALVHFNEAIDICENFKKNINGCQNELRAYSEGKNSNYYSFFELLFSLYSSKRNILMKLNRHDEAVDAANIVIEYALDKQIRLNSLYDKITVYLSKPDKEKEVKKLREEFISEYSDSSEHVRNTTLTVTIANE